MGADFSRWQRRLSRWPTRELVEKVKGEKAKLSLRIDKRKGVGNADVDFSMTYSILPLIDDISGKKRGVKFS
jgi:hypothetical protein